MEAVRHGQRGVEVLWAQSSRDAVQRALLHKLDQGIQNIRRAMPENGEVDQLSATYNNPVYMGKFIDCLNNLLNSIKVN